MNDSKRKLMLPRKISNYEESVPHLVIQSLYRWSGWENKYITPETVCAYIFSGNLNRLDEVKKWMKSLCKKNLLIKNGSNIYTITEDIYFAKNGEAFIYINEGDVRNILSINSKNVVELLIFYLRLIKSIDFTIKDSQTKLPFVGHMTHNYFIDKYDYSINTVCRYFKQLEDSKIIYVHRSGYNAKTRRQNTNLYGRYEDKDLIQDYACDNSLQDRERDEVGDLNRKISQQYNAYVKNPTNYSADEVAQLYADCVSYNNRMDANYNLTKFGEYLERKKDLGVFANIEIKG